MRLIKDDTPDSATPELYRYNVDVRLQRYPIIKETPYGWWIRVSYWQPDNKKWVSKTARGAWAKDTPEKALESYIARKCRQIAILEEQLDNARAWRELAKKMQKLAIQDVDTKDEVGGWIRQNLEE